MILPTVIPTPYIFYEDREELYLEMGIGEKGLKYEKKVYRELLKASKNKKISNILTDVEKPSGNNCNSPDIEMTINEKRVNLEVKSKLGDPMGNFSIKYDLDAKEFDLSTDNLNPKDKEALSEIFQDKIDDIVAYIKFARKQNPVSYNKSINKFPMYLSKEGSEAARSSGLAKKIADYESKNPIDVRTIFGLYNNGKNTYYVQIGNYGVYCLGFDKYKLGVPVLEGECIVEIRPFASGVKTRTDKITGKDVEVVSLGLRASPRMVSIKEKSPYTFDNEESIISLLSK